MSKFFFTSIVLSHIAAAALNAQAGEVSVDNSSTLQSSQELITARQTISLDGQWDFSYDPKEVGEKEKWFAPGAKLPEKTTVPGCVQAADHPSSGMSAKDYEAFHKKYGEHMMDLKYPCSAPAWQRREFVIPEAWRGQEVWLHIGGVNPAAEVWLNGEKLGGTVSSRTPLRCNLTKLCRFGDKNTLVVRTFWTKQPRLDGVFNFFMAFSGIYRGVRIEAIAPVHVKSLHALGKTDPRSAELKYKISGFNGDQHDLQVRCEIVSTDGKQKYAPTTTGKNSAVVSMPDAKLWSTQEPNLYKATVTVTSGDKVLDTASVRFGLRSIRREGRNIVLNGRPVYLRGGCDLHVYPETIAPPASKQFFIERLKKAKRYGFNYTKNCMEIYTDEFLEAADEVGFLVCQEMPTGLSGIYRTTIREKMPKEYIALYERELENVVRSDRNHPSVIVYAMISEFGIDGCGKDAFELISRRMPQAAKRLNPNALAVDVTCSGGSKCSANTQYGTRITDFFEEIVDDQYTQEPLSYPIKGGFRNSDRPVLLHEYAWWTSLPEISLAERYDNLPYRLNGVPRLKESAAKAGFTEQLPQFVANSRKMKRLMQKSGLEMARRCPDVVGYHFFLIQGLSWCQEGLFNEFFEEQPDVAPADFLGFNDDTALLLDDGNRRAFEWGRPAPLGVEVSHFGLQPLANPRLKWQLLRGGDVVVEGQIKLDPISCGTLTKSRPLGVVLPADQRPSELKLQTTLFDGDTRICQNYWTLWAFPAPQGGPWLSQIATDLPFLRKAYPQMKVFDPKTPPRPLLGEGQAKKNSPLPLG